jgi:chorismate-pyruvate lyase
MSLGSMTSFNQTIFRNYQVEDTRNDISSFNKCADDCHTLTEINLTFSREVLITNNDEDLLTLRS